MDEKGSESPSPVRESTPNPQPGAESVGRGTFIKGVTAFVAGFGLFGASGAKDVAAQSQPKSEEKKPSEKATPVVPIGGPGSLTPIEPKVNKHSGIIDTAPPDFMINEENSSRLQVKLNRLAGAVSTVMPDYVQRPRISHKTGAKQYSMYATVGKLDKGYIPTINSTSPDMNKTVEDYTQLRAAEEIADIMNQLKDGEPAKMMAKIYEENFRRNLNNDYEELSSVLSITEYVDPSGIREARIPSTDQGIPLTAYKETFSRVWMEPESFLGRINSLRETALKRNAANLALSVIWATLDTASRPTTMSSLGLSDQFIGKLINYSDQKENWQKILKIPTS